MSSTGDPEVDFKSPDIFREKLLDAAVPGFAAECNPEEAEAMGAFVEDALDWDEALAASFDLDEEDLDHA